MNDVRHLSAVPSIGPQRQPETVARLRARRIDELSVDRRRYQGDLGARVWKAMPVEPRAELAEERIQRRRERSPLTKLEALRRLMAIADRETPAIREPIPVKPERRR